MNPYTLTAKKEVDETAEHPYQVIITIDFHDDAFYEQLLAFVKQNRKLCIGYSERFQFTVGMKKDRQYTFDMVLRGEKIEETQQTLLDLLVDGKWTYSFHDQRLQEEFLAEGLQTLDHFLLKVNTINEEKAAWQQLKDNRSDADRRVRSLRWFVYLGGGALIFLSVYILSLDGVDQYLFENHYWFLIVYFIGIIAYIILIALMETRISRGYLTWKLALKTIGFVFIVLAIMILLIYLEG